MVKYLSEEWLEIGRTAVNNNEKFREIAKGMNLVIYHIITDVPKAGTIYFWSTFKDGECVEVKLGEKSEVHFTLSGTFTAWKAIHDGTLDIVQAVLEQKIKVEGKPVKGIKILKMAPLMNKIIAGIGTDFSEFA